jgi:hypothetical protein
MATTSSRRVSAALWMAAFAVTVLLAVFQRATGPSYPLRGALQLADGGELRYRLPRSSQGRDSLVISVPRPPGTDAAVLEWRRYPTDEPYRELSMLPTADGRLEAEIPRQPAAGKVEYVVRLAGADGGRVLPPGETVVARFRDPVPAAVLVPHIILIFGSMLVSTRALLEVARRGTPTARGLIVVAMGLLICGGLVLGPVVQKFAFGAYWTGWPLGTDLTDNKTLWAFLAWLPATVAALAGRRTRWTVVVGWAVMMGVFMIPHSLRGSELDWSQPSAVGEAAGEGPAGDPALQ